MKLKVSQDNSEKIIGGLNLQILSVQLEYSQLKNYQLKLNHHETQEECISNS